MRTYMHTDRWEKSDACVRVCTGKPTTSGSARHSSGPSVRWCSPPCVQRLLVVSRTTFSSFSSSTSFFSSFSSSSYCCCCCCCCCAAGGPGRRVKADTGPAAEERAPDRCLCSLDGRQPAWIAVFNLAWLGLANARVLIAKWSEEDSFSPLSLFSSQYPLQARDFVEKEIPPTAIKIPSGRFWKRTNGMMRYRWSGDQCTVTRVCVDDVDNGRGPHRAAGSRRWWRPAGVISLSLFFSRYLFW